MPNLSRAQKSFFLFLLLSFSSSNIVLAMPPIPEIPDFPTVFSYGQTYHVDKDNGSDLVNDGASEKPWATFQYGVNQLTAGDTLIVHEAVNGYDEIINISKTGSSNNWIVIKGADGESVVVKGGGMTFASNAKYIHLNNIDINIQDAGWMLLEIKNNAQYIVISDVEIDCHSSITNYTGVWVNAGGKNIWFKDMNIHHCGYKKTKPTDCSGVCLVRRLGAEDPLLDNIIFKNVTVSDNKGDGIGSQHVANVFFDGCIANNNTGDGFDIEAKIRAVFRNTISSNNGPEDQGHGFKVWSKESWFLNCVAFNNAYHGIHNKPLHLESSIYILNSTFAGNSKYRALGQVRFTNLFAREEPDLSTTKIFIYNNIFHTINTPGIAFGDWGNQTLVEEDKNYFFSAQENKMPRAYNFAIELRESWVGNANRFTKGYTFSDVDNGTWFKDTGYGKNDLGDTIKNKSVPHDPGFVKLYDDFRLKTGSRAIDAGRDVGLKTDFNGTPIPRRVAPDIGAYEY